MSGSPKGGGAGPPGDPRGGAGAARSRGQSHTPRVCSTGDPGPCRPHRPGGVCPPGQAVSSVPWTPPVPRGQSRRQNPVVRAGDRTPRSEQAAARGGRRRVGPEAGGSAGPLTRLCVPLWSWDAGGKVLPQSSSVRSQREAAPGPTLTLTLTLTMGWSAGEPGSSQLLKHSRAFPSGLGPGFDLILKKSFRSILFKVFHPQGAGVICPSGE